MTAFAAAINLLFADPNLGRSAIYRPAGGGDPFTVRVIRSAPDQVSEFNGGHFIADSVFLDLRVSEVVGPRKGDEIAFDGVRYILIGDARRDGERLVWKVEARAL